MISVKCTACQDGAWLPNWWKCDKCERVAHHSLHRPCSALTVDDAVNGLKHMADDHKCCAIFIGEVIKRMQNMEEACGSALWIRDRIQERGGFGAALEEWKEIETAIEPNKKVLP